MTWVTCDTCGRANNVRRTWDPEDQPLPVTNFCRHCGGEIDRRGGAVWRPLPSRPPLTRICCVNCGVENSVFDPTHNLCCGCGMKLFSPSRQAPGRAGTFFDRLFKILFFGGYGIGVLIVGGWWMIGLTLVVLAFPFYALFSVSPPAGLVALLLLVAWLLHRVFRPESVQRRTEARRRRQIKRELKSVGDVLPSRDT